MKASTQLSSAVFQLTPTRTRCDLIIIADDKKEKIASGLLTPFLTHLKTAQDQIAKGGYSILLEPRRKSDGAWFTKATLERFVRFVSNPGILERVYTIEAEILHMEEAISVQSSNHANKITVEDHHANPPADCEGIRKTVFCNFPDVHNSGDRSAPLAIDETAIVLYKPGAPLPEANGSCLQEGNSKVQLLKVLETRKTVLQKEQGMAFARAEAAGFDIDQITQLMSFAECFGAMRLMEACSRFMDLWKCKHETGQWLDVEASEKLSTLSSDFSAMDSSGIILSANPSKHDGESIHEPGHEKNLIPGELNDSGNPMPDGQKEHLPGQFPHFMFPPWAMHPPPGAQPVFPAYSMQGVPYYQAYPGNGPFFQQPHNLVEHDPLNFEHQSGQKIPSFDVMYSTTGPETWEVDETISQNDMDAEVSQNQRLRKRAGGSNKKKSGTVVIQNINYIASKKKRSGSESSSNSDTDIGSENENTEDDDHAMINQSSKRSSNRGSHLKSVAKVYLNNDEASNLGKDTNGSQWQAFQNCLMRRNDEDAHARTEAMFAMEKDVNLKRRVDTVGYDPLAFGTHNDGETHDARMTDMSRMSGSMSCWPRRSDDDVLLSRADDFRESNQKDGQFSEATATKTLCRKTHEDFMIGSQHHHSYSRNSSDSLALNRFEGGSTNMDREISHGTADEAFIIPFRSMSIDQVGGADRAAIDIDSEIPSAHQMLDSEASKNKVNYEPDDLSLMPERETEKRSVGYDLGLEYEMQVSARGSHGLEYEMQVSARGSHEEGEKDITDAKGVLRKSDKYRNSKVISDSSYQQRTGGPVRKGKSSKLTPSEDARARAEKLRSYKADLQKLKKEKDEEEAKRLEALKLERQKRIAARGSSTAAKPATLSPQGKQLPSKLSPAANRGSKFSDSDPGSSSPLQRSKIRISLGSKHSPGTNYASNKASKLNESSHMTGNRLTRSTSSLSETKIESNRVTPDSKPSTARIRRLSEPKTVNSPPVTLLKTRSAEVAPRRKLYEGPEKNKISAIINLDRSKAATLPELKIKTLKSQVNAGDNTSDVEEGIKINANDNPIVEKTVVMLEYEKPSVPTWHSSEENSVRNLTFDDCARENKIDGVSGLVPTNASTSPMEGVDQDTMILEPPKHMDTDEVRIAYSEDPPNNNTAGKPYQAPYARVSSLEDPCTDQLEYCKAPLIRSEVGSRGEETIKAHVSETKTLKLDKYAIPAKASVKDSSKGLRRLLKLGKKNLSSSMGQSVDSVCTSVDGSEHNDNSRPNASASEVYTLKNLISRDETSHAGDTSQKSKSSYFSLFSPFRSKTSGKKQAS